MARGISDVFSGVDGLLLVLPPWKGGETPTFSPIPHAHLLTYSWQLLVANCVGL